MFDTMTMTKIVGGFCGAFLVFLLGGFVAEFVYGTAEGHGPEHQAYTVAVAEPASGGSGAAADSGPDFQTVFASADPAAGEKVFRNCKSCHSVEPGKNMVGPSLYGVVGRAVDTEPGYSYSGALAKVVDAWTPENMNHFLSGPRNFAPGTKMTFAGLKDIKDRANIIAWLQSLPNK